MMTVKSVGIDDPRDEVEDESDNLAFYVRTWRRLAEKSFLLLGELDIWRETLPQSTWQNDGIKI